MFMNYINKLASIGSDSILGEFSADYKPTVPYSHISCPNGVRFNSSRYILHNGMNLSM